MMQLEMYLKFGIQFIDRKKCIYNSPLIALAGIHLFTPGKGMLFGRKMGNAQKMDGRLVIGNTCN